MPATAVQRSVSSVVSVPRGAVVFLDPCGFKRPAQSEQVHQVLTVADGGAGAVLPLDRSRAPRTTPGSACTGILITPSPSATITSPGSTSTHATTDDRDVHRTRVLFVGMSRVDTPGPDGVIKFGKRIRVPDRAVDDGTERPGGRRSGGQGVDGAACGCRVGGEQVVGAGELQPERQRRPAARSGSGGRSDGSPRRRSGACIGHGEGSREPGGERVVDAVAPCSFVPLEQGASAVRADTALYRSHRPVHRGSSPRRS